MRKRNFPVIILILYFFCSCSVSKHYNPAKKFVKADLQKDYMLLREILEKKHPALYWYTPKDSMDFYFDSLYARISDSMTELQFGWKILAPLTNKIHCGHTSISMSRNYGKFMRGKRAPGFPLLLKLWGDTMVVTANLNQKDSVLRRGTIITSINGLSTQALVHTMFQYLPLDGYSDNVNYVRVSGNFPHYHRSIFGLYRNYSVGYLDSTGAKKLALLPMYRPIIDSAHKKRRSYQAEKMPRWKRKKERKESYRSLEIDTSRSTAILSLHTFSNGGGRHLRSFLRRSFRTMRQQQVQNLVIDLRSNGGGDVNMYVKLTRYIRNRPFKVADTSYAVAKNLAPYTSYIRNGFFTNIGLLFLTKRQRDGNYHFGYWERHLYKPKKSNHFDGRVFVLTNGPTFSASTLFCNAVKGQANVTLAGEETGGGWHGNSGIMIPDITLPATKLRVRLPLFKLVQYDHVPKNGRGVWPDIYIPPSVDGVKRNIDRKMEIVKELISTGSKTGAGMHRSSTAE
jgi:hypothetical protein